MEKMRASACVHLQTSTANRVALLIEDYPHLVTNTDTLMNQLSHLIALHGHEKIKAWRTLAEAEQIGRLVEELLREHYDPAYLRSIEKNFSGYARARQLVLEDIAAVAFNRAARQLIDDEATN
jgi:tRNA 2-selenouridine synthase